jgi:hypothetical protein
MATSAHVPAQFGNLGVCPLRREERVFRRAGVRRAVLGYPVTERGPCVGWYEPARRYVPQGARRYGSCAAVLREPGPELDGAVTAAEAIGAAELN